VRAPFKKLIERFDVTDSVLLALALALYNDGEKGLEQAI
jgi:hypothetical protein